MLNSATKFLKNGQDYITYGEYVAKHKTGNNFGEIEDEIIINLPIPITFFLVKVLCMLGLTQNPAQKLSDKS